MSMAAPSSAAWQAPRQTSFCGRWRARAGRSSWGQRPGSLRNAVRGAPRRRTPRGSSYSAPVRGDADHTEAPRSSRTRPPDPDTRPRQERLARHNSSGPDEMYGSSVSLYSAGRRGRAGRASKAEPGAGSAGRGAAGAANGRRGPQMWWLLFGLLSLLPIHAARHHATSVDSVPQTVLDRVVSSYTSTVRVLIYARRCSSADGIEDGGRVEDGGMMVVAMPDTPSTPALPGAKVEAIALRDLYPWRTTILTGPEATRARVLYGDAAFPMGALLPATPPAKRPTRRPAACCCLIASTGR